MSERIDKLAQDFARGEQGAYDKGDAVSQRMGGGYLVYTAAKPGHTDIDSRILERAPKPAWHDAVAVMAVTPASPSRGVLVGAGEGEWYSYRWNRYVKSDDLRDVTPLIEAKVTDEMVRRLEKHFADHSNALLPFGLAPRMIAAALGLDPA